MERAASACLKAVHAHCPDSRSVAILCGKGGNGGDGYALARLLCQEGRSVTVFSAFLEAEHSPDAHAMRQRAIESGVRIIDSDTPDWRAGLKALEEHDLLVDALFGTGSRAPEGAAAEAVKAMDRSGVPVLAIDLPTGVHCDTGEELGQAVSADWTVTIGWPKPGLLQGDGIELRGELTIAEIGYPEPVLDARTDAYLLDEDWVDDRIEERSPAAHKGTSGRILLIAGSEEFPGAAALCALGAQHGGAGLVTVAAPPEVCTVVAAQVPEAIFAPMECWDEEVLRAKADVCDACVIGPGLTPERASSVLKIADWSAPIVLDADALNALAAGAEAPDAACLVTPHPGELSRLLEVSIAEIQHDRFRMAREAADRLDLAVLLKGPHSIVAEVGQPLLVNSTGNPGMATAGMGDVLAGLCGLLLAQGLSPREAAGVAMFLHGMAGDILAEDGPIGYTASELAAAIPRARAKLAALCGD